MAEKRKDSRGRILRSGESQRKDGMYMYRYVDVMGIRRSVYSWRLVATKIPAGKQACEPLRELEKHLEKDVSDGIQTFVTSAKTLNNCFDGYDF